MKEIELGSVFTTLGTDLNNKFSWYLIKKKLDKMEREDLLLRPSSTYSRCKREGSGVCYV